MRTSSLNALLISTNATITLTSSALFQRHSSISIDSFATSKDTSSKSKPLAGSASNPSLDDSRDSKRLRMMKQRAEQDTPRPYFFCEEKLRALEDEREEKQHIPYPVSPLTSCQRHTPAPPRQRLLLSHQKEVEKKGSAVLVRIDTLRCLEFTSLPSLEQKPETKRESNKGQNTMEVCCA